MSEIRIDRSSEISSVIKTDEGYLRVKAPVARTGVYNYMLSDGTVQREYVPPETLFAQDSIDSLKLKPVTDKHPSKFVDSSTFKSDAVGYVTETIDQIDNLLYTEFLVTSNDGIDSINDGSRQLSPGYRCEVIKKSGITPSGEHYDAIQTNRKYNHLALVDKARGGDALSFKIDSVDGVELLTETEEIVSMATIRIDGVDHAIENEAIANHIASLNTRVDSITALENEKVELCGKVDSLEAELKTEKASRLDAEEIQKRVDAKVELIEKAKSIVPEIKTDASDVEIMQSVIEAKFPSVELKLDGYNEDQKAIYLKARFDSAVEMHNADIVADNREDMKPNDNNNERVDAREAFIDKLESQYKGA